MFNEFDYLFLVFTLNKLDYLFLVFMLNELDYIGIFAALWIEIYKSILLLQ